MRKWLLVVVATLALLVALVLAIGWSLPVAHSASRTLVVPAPPEQVFALVSDFGNYPRWRTGVTRVDVSGPPGVGQSATETADYGVIPYVVEAWDPPGRLVTRITGDLPFGGTWTYDLRSTEAGSTSVTITEDGEVYNVFFRFMSRFVFGHTATIDQYLVDLDAALRATSGAGRSRP